MNFNRLHDSLVPLRTSRKTDSECSPFYGRCLRVGNRDAVTALYPVAKLLVPAEQTQKNENLMYSLEMWQTTVNLKACTVVQVRFLVGRRDLIYRAACLVSTRPVRSMAKSISNTPLRPTV